MPARLHHERLDGAAATGAIALFTHGIYGAGGNWRSIARAVVTRRPEWSALLVDLRLHGKSEAGLPPHTVAACADDLAALIASVGPVAVAIGHSFGGKVVLALRAGGAALAQTWVLDSTPSARPGAWDLPDNSVREVWTTFSVLDRTWARRDDFIEAAVARGHARTLATWMATNLVPADGGLRLRLALEPIRSLLLDYYATDLWPALTSPALAGDAHMVVATRSDTVSLDDRARLAALPADARVHTHAVDAGHWLHLDAPTAVVDLLAAALPPA